MPDICERLAEAVDINVLSKLADEPKTTDTTAIELVRLEKEADVLDRKIEKGSANLLVADPAVFGELQKTLLGWKQEVAKVRNTITLVKVKKPDEAKAVAELVARWQARKAQLVLVRDGKPLVIAKDAAGRARCKVADLERVVPIYAEPAALRDLLHALKCTVTLHWTPNGKRHWTLEKGVLSAIFEDNFICRYMNTPAKPVTSPSNTSRGRCRRPML